MSQNCKTTYTAATTRDANNNTLYHGAATPGYGGRGYTPPSVKSNGNYQQVTAKVLFGSVTAINDLKQQKTGRDERRTH
ncbi:uncharacterized protein LOC123871786 [Maniola jurtina]|uniref:uncharacterized protein LOC123871786 n=1 Tax=Maniola jurtina TaxID=191418 RepID=UPI001E68A22A|nr:uncharacterized protein LOC123871786 [Maniola jurtina]XP_045771685.1 uncharacterized protein LOC123871786 [Maniola jurtina]XP_045771686.1 uncharacterized protein LOC123871786 [Maniola jurtina]XP_045771687.1 uncharacterized protein LOC123871786 [Maniola jurtina]XP_045771688.1 uncharacterized protein LOC123871786 [Maniola jurtina]